jgi:L-ascorbate metabolism protein UlaG (beta-lactamase superfamily)
MLVEEDGRRLLIDPGIFSTGQNDAKDVDVLLITHEHSDHYHLDSIRMIIAHNPAIKIITNRAVGKLLEEAGIAYEPMEHGESRDANGVMIEAMETQHAEIYKTLPRVANTGFFINRRFWYPGDALHDPGRRPEILALPVAGPWIKISEAIDYGLLLRPKIAFPVHDGFVSVPGVFHRWPKLLLEEQGARFDVLEANMIADFG